MSPSKAENQVKTAWESGSRKHSYYVVRFSNENVGVFTLTYITTNGSIHHENIINREGSLILESTKDSADNWKKLKIIMKQTWHLEKHIPSGPYEKLAGKFTGARRLEQKKKK